MSSDVFISGAVEEVLRLYDGLVDERAWGRTAGEQIEMLAQRLLEGHGRGLPGAAFELRNWLPTARGRSAQELLEQPLSIDDALDTVARAHGFAAWAAAGSSAQRADSVFEDSVEALLRGDISGLTTLLARAPDLVTRRSHYDRATLLHYLAANGVETYRQRVPRNASQLALLLIGSGANPLAIVKMYGRDHTTRSLLVSSSHPSAAGVTDDILSVLDGASGSA